jgi:hypothetical protein
MAGNAEIIDPGVMRLPIPLWNGRRDDFDIHPLLVEEGRDRFRVALPYLGGGANHDPVYKVPASPECSRECRYGGFCL